MTDPLGWKYPAGAQDDPKAPWNGSELLVPKPVDYDVAAEALVDGLIGAGKGDLIDGLWEFIGCEFLDDLLASVRDKDGGLELLSGYSLLLRAAKIYVADWDGETWSEYLADARKGDADADRD